MPTLKIQTKEQAAQTKPMIKVKVTKGSNRILTKRKNKRLLSNRLNNLYYFMKMLKFIPSVLFFCAAIFFSCKKDAPTYPAPPSQTTKDTTATPIKLYDVIYPNPCKGIFTISTNITDTQNVLIVDLMGRTKLNIDIYGTTAIVDTSLSNGVYIVRLSGKAGTFQSKLIVQK